MFSDSPNAFVPGKQVSHAKLQRDYRGSDVFSDVAEPRRPGTALSTAKANDMRGQDIFSDGPAREKGEVSEARAAAEACLAVTLATQKAVELLGPIGYSRELLLEKWMRDAKINDIFEGTQQINMLIVARRILGYSSAELG